ncbi:hypothetical protein [Wandonia haliotis]
MNKETILNAINISMTERGRLGSYNVRPALEITTNMGFHKMKYEVKLASGLLIIHLTYKNGKLSYYYEDHYDSPKNAADYADLAASTAHFDKNIDVATLSSMFGQLPTPS